MKAKKEDLPAYNWRTTQHEVAAEAVVKSTKRRSSKQASVTIIALSLRLKRLYRAYANRTATITSGYFYFVNPAAMVRTRGQEARDVFKRGFDLWKENKYKEAQKSLEEAVKTQERIYSEDHKDALESKYWLGCTLLHLKQDKDAKEMLQKVLKRREKDFHKKRQDTIGRKYYLACALHGEKKYIGAEMLLQTVVEVQERDLGSEHEDTLNSKLQLARVLYGLEKYSEAKNLLQDLVQVLERDPKEDPKNKLGSQGLLERALCEQKKYREAGETLQKAANGKEKVFGQDDKEIPELLRLFQESQLKSSHPHSDSGEKVKGQVLTEKLVEKKDLALAKKLITRRILGEAATGNVEEVIAEGNDKPMARKQFFVHNFDCEGSKRKIKRIENELNIMTHLSHPHIVTMLGYYQEKDGPKHCNIYALMQPVGDNDLEKFLQGASIENGERSHWIKRWFVCLTSALVYIHSKRIHHEDIKPSNAIHRGDQVFFTDFGSSRRLKDDALTTSTASAALATKLFAAPEAFPSDDGEYLRHGSKTDVFSLGLVFVELLVVLTGKEIETLRKYVFSDHKSGPKQYHRVMDKFDSFFSNDTERNDGIDALAIYSQHFKCMLHKERKERPSAEEVLTNMKKAEFFKPGLECECAREGRQFGTA